MSGSIVLLSAGLDSLVSLYMAKKDGPVRLAITFDYGQKSAAREIDKARAVCRALELDHLVIELAWLERLTKSALVDRNEDLPEMILDDFERDKSFFKDAAKQVWVPNRNGVFVNIAAAYAEQLGASYVVAGFNKEEAATFPDNSIEFIDSTNTSLAWSTLSNIELKSYLSNMEKFEIVKAGVDLGVDFKFLWSCYCGGGIMCGRCEACNRVIRAFTKAGYNKLLPEMEGKNYAKYVSRRIN